MQVDSAHDNLSLTCNCAACMRSTTNGEFLRQWFQECCNEICYTLIEKIMLTLLNMNHQSTLVFHYGLSFDNMCYSHNWIAILLYMCRPIRYLVAGKIARVLLAWWHAVFVVNLRVSYSKAYLTIHWVVTVRPSWKLAPPSFLQHCRCPRKFSLQHSLGANVYDFCF